MEKIKSIGIWTGPRMKNAEFLTEKIERTLRRFSPDISVKLIVSPPAMLPGLKHCLPFDVIMVLGGDGTILGATRHFAPLMKPIIGVNFGEVGFLCAIESLDDNLSLFRLVDGNYQIENRMMIEGRVFRKIPAKEKSQIFSSLAFSEITVKSTENNRMITVGYSINGSEEEEIRSDGMMVVTPTGSTGYSLSCNGPVIMPEVESLIINAIAPHTLHFRPIVAEKHSRVVFRLLRTKGEGAIFWADMQERFPLQINDEIEITASPIKAQMIFFQKDYFLRAVKEKLR